MKEIDLVVEVERYISFLKSISLKDLESIVNKEKEIVFGLKQIQGKEIDTDKAIKLGNVDAIITMLEGMDSREEGKQYVQSLSLNRKQLELILKKLDVPVQKKDTIVKLYAKIIDSTIGYKLRSAAIQKQ